MKLKEFQNKFPFKRFGKFGRVFVCRRCNIIWKEIDNEEEIQNLEVEDLGWEINWEQGDRKNLKETKFFIDSLKKSVEYCEKYE